MATNSKEKIDSKKIVWYGLYYFNGVCYLKYAEVIWNMKDKFVDASDYGHVYSWPGKNGPASFSPSAGVALKQEK